MTTTVLAYIPSPPQGVWDLFGVVPLRAYALCIIAGIIAALVLGDRRWVARGGEPGVVYDVALWAVPFGLIGGRVYHVMTDWPKYFGADGAGFAAALRIWDGGLGIWGAVALGGVGAWIACRRKGIPLPAFGDAVAPGIILAQAIGRLGNYFNQELYGRETEVPWGLTIYERLDPSGVVSPYSLDGVSTGQVFAVVHPTFLYELLWNLLIFALLLLVDRRFTIGHGRLFALYVAGYCVGRFWVELMRSDAATLIAGIRINTFTSMFVFIGAVIYIMVAPKGREDPATLKPDDAVKELAAVGASGGVVGAATAAGEDGTQFEAVAEAEDLVEQVESAPSEDIVEAEAFAEEGAAADAEREAGLGPVEGDEAVEAEVAAPEAHEAAVEAAEPGVAVEGTEVAEALEAEPVSEDGDEVVAGEESASEVHDAAVEDFAVESDEPTDTAEPDRSAPEAGLGAVDGDEVVAAEESASEVHDAAVEGEAGAEELAEDVAVVADDESAEPAAGLGAVDGDEAAAAEESAPEVHDAAVEGEAVESAAPTDAAEPDRSAPEAGLGAVDGDEVAAAEKSAPEVHDAAVEGEADAEVLAENVAVDPAVETDAGADELADAASEPAAPDAGLGAVDGDEVAAVEESAPEVHDAAVEGAADAEQLAEAEANEPTDSATDPSDPEAGRGAVDGGEVVAEDSAAEVHDESVESGAVAEDVATEPDEGAGTPERAEQAPDAAPRRRWWRRG